MLAAAPEPACGLSTKCEVHWRSKTTRNLGPDLIGRSKTGVFTVCGSTP
jgi:hypothetical protein